MIGWAAVRGGLTWQVLPLFLMVFVLQVPTFWPSPDLPRPVCAGRPADAAGLHWHRPRRRRTHGVGGAWCGAASLTPLWFGTSAVDGAGAALLGLGFLALVLGFLRCRRRAARGAPRASLVYLPGVFALLLLDVAMK